MTPEQIMDRFVYAQNLLIRLMRTEGRRQGYPFKGLVVDASIRLKQAQHLLRRFRGAELEPGGRHVGLHATSNVGGVQHPARIDELRDEIRLTVRPFIIFRGDLARRCL